jgi:iron complex transport system ATP-binding protein
MILRLEDIEFNYASRTILKDISFTLKSNEIIALLGPNGVGKTTLLKCINRILRIRSGTIFIGEYDLYTLGSRAIAREMGYVAQRSEAARLTVFDAVLLGRHPHMGFNAAKKDIMTVSAVLARLNLSNLSLRYIDELSGGELQKVCIARALVQEPRLLLLDEPTTSLDLKNQVEILKLIKEIVSGHEVSVIMSVHDLNMAIHYADRFVFLKDNAIYAVCTKNDISEKLIQEVYGIEVSIHYTEEYPIVIPAKY